ncbi:MAG: efflux RND transporter permease subunit [Chromatiaceae bacterium]|nr:efflux RND transporter permease subunit [Chromatiaceae bacterium]
MKHKAKYRVRRFGAIRNILAFFIESPLTPLILGASLLLGALAIFLLPREEEPQIVVPMIDIFVQMPGASAQEVEQRITKPLEKLIWELPGVEYLYSTSSPGGALTVVRFLVGWNEERAIVEVNQKIAANLDLIPHGANPPLVKPRRIDDVPILALTLHGDGVDGLALRRIAAALNDEVKQVRDVAETTLIGGLRRQVRVELDASRLIAYGIDPNEVVVKLDAANRQSRAGSLPTPGGEILVETGGFLADVGQVGAVVVGAYQGQLVYLRDLAQVLDGPEEPTDYVLFGRGPRQDGADPAGSESGITRSAVTLAIAKRPGTNAIEVSNRVLEKVALLQGHIIPAGVEVTVTRNYGRTATDKSNELLLHMGLAVVGVSILVGMVLGVREAFVVAIAIPMTLALTLATFYLLGFTLNRVTLFALIFSIGILVDDPIVDVENIVRHFRLFENRGRPLSEVVIDAVNEVRSPLILATLTVIAAVLPMAFVQGLMGPYMRPIPVGATAAMLFSMMVSFVVTPWAANRMLGRLARHRPPASAPPREDWTTRLYRRVMGPLIAVPWRGLAFLFAITLSLLAACGLIWLGAVKVKMLPFDNKSELQLIVDMDEGTSLEQTTQVAQELAAVVSQEPEVTDYQIYAGTAAPYNFNGLVRHYFLRRGPNLADIQVNFVPKEDRQAQSHEIAKRLRERIQPIVQRHRARVKVAEVPPGPPVLQTLVAEIYGPDYGQQIANAIQVREILEQTPGVVDVDWYMEETHPRIIIRFDQEKAARNGISASQVERLVSIAEAGVDTGLLHVSGELEDVPIRVRLPLDQRAEVSQLLGIPLRTPNGGQVPLGELVRLERTTGEHSLYRKNLLPVVYVTADVAGDVESPVYAILDLGQKIRALQPVGAAPGEGMTVWSTRQPFSTLTPSVKWDGEWHITYEVFRDLGAAFAVVLVLIYTLIVGWFRSLRAPFIIMAAIPFSLVGILPAHWAMGAFFTATSMIGFMAGAGIVVRNSIILVDFIKLRNKQGMPLAQAVVDAGAVRFRPMMLTAAAVVVSGSVILFDPIFQGLAISLMAGEVASLLLSRMAVPIIYYQAMRDRTPAAVGEATVVPTGPT